MVNTVDARGFSCPQPVLMSLEQMKKMDRGEILVLVDTDTSEENVARAAESQGWRVEKIENEGGGYRIRIVKD